MKRLTALLTMCIMFTLTAVSAQAAANVAALMYHSVTSDESRMDDYTVSPEQFENDIKYFTEHGYITLTASELANESMANIDGRKILLITLDDGYENFYTEVFPILKKYNAKATMFLIGSYIDRYGYVTQEQVYEMAHSGLVEIGNHTDNIHHAPVEHLKTIYNNPNCFYDIIDDIKNNNNILKNITGYDITSISWPYGYYTESIDSAVKNNLGYKISFSTQYGVNYFTGNTYTPLKRMNREHSATTEQVFERADSKFN